MKKSWVIFFCGFSCIFMTFCICQSAVAKWEISEGGNGHWYEAVSVTEGITWADADTAVQAMAGDWHLVTITSVEENDFVFDLINNKSEFWTLGGYSSLVGQMHKGPWIGGYSSSYIANDWQWETGEAFVFSDWGPYEPFGNGDRICWSRFGDSGPYGWNDARNNGIYTVPGYIVESEHAYAYEFEWIGLQTREFVNGQVFNRAYFGITPIDTYIDLAAISLTDPNNKSVPYEGTSFSSWRRLLYYATEGYYNLDTVSFSITGQ